MKFHHLCSKECQYYLKDAPKHIVLLQSKPGIDLHSGKERYRGGQRETSAHKDLPITFYEAHR